MCVRLVEWTLPERRMTVDEQADDDPTVATSKPDAGPTEPVVRAMGLGVDGEHGPLFSGIDLALPPGFHAVRMPGGTPQDVLLLTIAGRFAPSRGVVSVLGDTGARNIRRHCAIAAFADIDELDESVTIRTVLTEQCRWLAPWYARRSASAGRTVLEEVYGDLPVPSAGSFVSELSDVDVFLLRVCLALLSDRPILVVGDLEQVRDQGRRALAVERLGTIAATRTVVVGVTNPLGIDAPEHDLHDHRILTGGDR